MKLVVLAAAIALSACGGSSSSDNIAGFVGTWTIAPGQTVTISCNGQSQTGDATGSAVFAMGVDADLSVTDNSCTLLFDVTGNSAAIRSGQSCSSTSNGTTTVTTFQTYNLTLSADGQSMSQQEMATATLSGASTGTCTLAGTLTANKVSN